MERIKLFFLKLILNKFLLGYLVRAWDLLQGYRTQIFFCITLGIAAAEHFGYISADLAKQLYPAFGSAAAFAFMEKLKRYEPIIDELVKLARDGHGTEA